MHICPKCKTEYEREDAFPMDRSRVSGRYPYCKHCASALQLVWRDRNPDKHREIVRRRLDRIKKANAAREGDPDEA